MSMIEAQIRDLEKLREKLNIAKRNDFVRMDSKDADIARSAIDTIQTLSAKLAAENLKNGLWIPCNERLPEDEKEVLACWEMHSLHTNTIYRYISILYLTDGGWYCEQGKPNGKVTHWMDLPELPKMDGGTE